MTTGGKAVYLNQKMMKVTPSPVALNPLVTTLFGEGYYSPDSMSSGVEDYVEANAGVR